MLFLRKVMNEDVDLLFTWVNETTARLNSFHSAEIDYEEHKKWFDKITNSTEQLQYIMMCDSEAIGQVRLLVKEDEAEIDYSISEQYRGNGYGKEIIRLVKETVRSELPHVSKLVAKVKPSNIASISCFVRNQFEEKFQHYEYLMENFEPCPQEVKTEAESSGGGGKNFMPYE